MGCTWLMVPHGFLSTTTSPSMDQLKGKTMAISSPGAFPDIFAKGALAHFNMPADAVNMPASAAISSATRPWWRMWWTPPCCPANSRRSLRRSTSRCWCRRTEALPKVLRMCLTTSGRRSRRGRKCRRVPAGEMWSALCRRPQRRELKVTQQVTDIKPDDPRPAYIYDLAMQQTPSVPRCRSRWIISIG